MSLVAFVSGRSPGLTTAVHALAAAWPATRRAIVAELDPAGGSLAARHELAPEPGLTNLAAAGRRGLNPDTVLRHCRRLPSGVIALVAPINPDRMASALAVLGSELGDALDSIPGTDVLADCGRVDRRSPALDLVRAAPYAVLVVTPSLEGVAHAQARLATLSFPPGGLAVLTIGQHPYHPDEVGAALGLPVLGALARDPAGAAQLNGTGRGTRRAAERRRELHRSAKGIAQTLAGVLAALAPAGPPGATVDRATSVAPATSHGQTEPAFDEAAAPSDGPLPEAAVAPSTVRSRR
jgi:hypothetical protein